MDSTPTTDQIDARIARAIDGVKELMRAHMETQDAKLDAIIRRLDDQAGVRDEVEDLRTRMVSAEAFIHSHEKDLNYRKVNLPTILIATAGLVLGAIGTVATVIALL